jgi:type I restriction enzyme M protein
MREQSTQLVQKLGNYCNILRDDGLSYGDCVEQLTFLLFLKMADEAVPASVRTLLNPQRRRISH